MNGDRDKILGRIAEALTVPARPPHHGHSYKPAGPSGGMPSATPLLGANVTSPFREWLPPVGPTSEERHALFARQCAALRADVVECADFAAAAARIASLAEAANWKKLALHSGSLTDALAPLLPQNLELLRTDSGYDKFALETCDAGLTECECLVAQTGSVCVTSRSSGGRALSVFPPHHLVIARRSQLEPDLTAAYELLARKYQGKYPSFVSFITGPSRTGDIERILVLGAHGPKWLTILLVP